MKCRFNLRSRTMPQVRYRRGRYGAQAFQRTGERRCAVFNVFVEKPAKVVKALWHQSRDVRRQPRQGLMIDGCWREIKPVIDPANIAVDLHLPLRLSRACNPWRFVGACHV